VSNDQTTHLSERDGIPYGEIYRRIREHRSLSDEGGSALENEPARWDRPEIVKMFQRLGTVPASYTASQAALRVLLAADEMAEHNGVSTDTVYACLVRFTDPDDPDAVCVDPPRCPRCPVRDLCRHATRSPRMKDLPPSERPRERLLSLGEDALRDAELLAILIGGGTGADSAMDLAQRLLTMFGDLRGIAAAGNQEIKDAIKGLGDARIARIRSAFALGRRLAAIPVEPGMTVRGSQQIFRHFVERLKDKKKEVFISLLLDTRHNLIREHRVAVGSLNESVVHPREVFKKALKESAHAVLFVHNHPSGDPAPSPQDRHLTQRLCEAGKLMGIRVLDHMIVGRDAYYSFAEENKLSS
jgi:DNA repair protein RadC